MLHIDRKIDHVGWQALVDHVIHGPENASVLWNYVYQQADGGQNNRSQP